MKQKPPKKTVFKTKSCWNKEENRYERVYHDVVTAADFGGGTLKQKKKRKRFVHNPFVHQFSW